MVEIDLWEDFTKAFAHEKRVLTTIIGVILFLILIFVLIPLTARLIFIALEKGLTAVMKHTFLLRITGAFYLAFFVFLYLIFFRLKKTPFPQKNCIGFKEKRTLVVGTKYTDFYRKNQGTCLAVADLQRYKEVVLIRSNIGNPLLILPVEKEGNCLVSKIPSMRNLEYNLYEIGALGEKISVHEVFLGDPENTYAAISKDEEGGLVIRVNLHDAKNVRVVVEGKEVARFNKPGTYKLELIDRIEDETTILLPDLADSLAKLVKFSCNNFLSLERALLTLSLIHI